MEWGTLELPLTNTGRCAEPYLAHPPPWKSAKSGGREYVLFKAAQDGYLGCVRHLIEQDRVSPFTSSKNAGYTTLDYAQWGDQPGKEAVVDYLERLGARPKPTNKTKVFGCSRGGGGT